MGRMLIDDDEGIARLGDNERVLDLGACRTEWIGGRLFAVRRRTAHVGGWHGHALERSLRPIAERRTAGGTVGGPWRARIGPDQTAIGRRAENLRRGIAVARFACLRRPSAFRRAHALQRFLRQARRGAVSRARQRLAYRPDQKRTHPVGVAEAQFRLGRMHVHIDFLRRNIDEQRDHGIATSRHEIAIGGPHSSCNQAVANRAAVDDEIDAEPIRPVKRRQARVALDTDIAAGRGDRQCVLHEVGPENTPETRQRMVQKPWRTGIEAQRRPFAIGQRKCDLGMGQRQALHRVYDGGALGPFGLHEFQARRRRVEEIAHFDIGTRRASSRSQRCLAAPIDLDAVRLARAPRTAGEGEPCDSADGRERLAPEAKRENVGEVIARQFRRGVPLDGKCQILGAHAGAVVRDTNELKSAAARRHIDPRCASVDCVFDQFLDDASGPLDHLTRGNAIYEVRRQLTNGHALPQFTWRNRPPGAASP